MLRSTNGRLLRNLITRHSLPARNGPLSLSTRLYTTKKENDESLSTTNKSTSPEMPLLISKQTRVLSTNEKTSEPKIEPKLSLTFTCTAPGCSERSTHLFTRRAYQKGVVVVQCPGCKNRHLIADHLGWFKDSTEGGKLSTVEDFAKALGEKVRRGKLDLDGTVEYVE